MNEMYSMLGLEPFNQTQIKILEGAKACVVRWGTEKTNLNDISKESGVTRPTIYSYFNTKEAVIKQALLLSGYEFAQKLVSNIDMHSSFEDRYIESVIYAIQNLPNEPYLGLITQADLSDLVKHDALQNPAGILICTSIFEKIFEGQTLSQQDLFEIIEITVRFALSLVTIEGPLKRNEKELRGFIKRRLLPSTGIKS